MTVAGAPGAALEPTQPGNLKLAICVLQSRALVAFMYWFVYQKVQSSSGSTIIEV